MNHKPILYIPCGLPGCGKTTWCNSFIRKYNNVRYVSRDEIRFSMIKDDEDYFSHENDVFKKFSGTIAQTLIDGFDVIADATHISVGSRKKLIRAIDSYGFLDYNIIFIYFDTPYEICCGRNIQRKGRERVPSEVIENMQKNFQKPAMLEDRRSMGLMYCKGVM